MALQFEFEKYHKKFPKAYCVVNTIIWKLHDEEYQIQSADGNLITKYKKSEKSEGIAFIYADEIARKNRVIQLDAIKFEFDYDRQSPKNILTQAYDSIKTLEGFEESIDC